jgi:hypothetical protein
MTSSGWSTELVMIPEHDPARKMAAASRPLPVSAPGLLDILLNWKRKLVNAMHVQRTKSKSRIGEARQRHMLSGQIVLKLSGLPWCGLLQSRRH